MRVLDLFSGIGGFSLGLERAGMQTVAFCEIEPYPRAVLRKHWPNVPCYDDIRTLTADRLRADGIVPNVICGGFPCQDISTAGLGAGINKDTRSGLWEEYARLIGEIRPQYVIVENVAALLGRGLERVLGDLAQIRYDAEWHCIPASYIGAWHRRDRVWLVAYPDKDSGQQGFATGSILGQRNLHEQSQRSFTRWPGRSNLPKSRICGRNDGVPAVVDRIAALGNAVIPQIPEIIGRAIMSVHNQGEHP